MITLGIVLDFFISIARTIMHKFSNKKQGKNNKKYLTESSLS